MILSSQSTVSTNMSNLDLIRLRDNVERRRQVDSEIRIVKKSFRRRYSSKTRFLWTMKFSDSDMASSIHTFDENYQDTQDYNLSDEDIPARDQILVVSFLLNPCAAQRKLSGNRNNWRDPSRLSIDNWRHTSKGARFKTKATSGPGSSNETKVLLLTKHHKPCFRRSQLEAMAWDWLFYFLAVLNMSKRHKYSTFLLNLTLLFYI